MLDDAVADLDTAAVVRYIDGASCCCDFKLELLIVKAVGLKYGINCCLYDTVFFNSIIA